MDRRSAGAAATAARPPQTARAAAGVAAAAAAAAAGSGSAAAGACLSEGQRESLAGCGRPRSRLSAGRREHHPAPPARCAASHSLLQQNRWRCAAEQVGQVAGPAGYRRHHRRHCRCRRAAAESGRPQALRRCSPGCWARRRERRSCRGRTLPGRALRRPRAPRGCWDGCCPQPEHQRAASALAAACCGDGSGRCQAGQPPGAGCLCLCSAVQR